MSGVGATALVVMAGVAPFAGRLADRHGPLPTLALGLAGVAAGCALIALAGHAVGGALGAVAGGLGFDHTGGYAVVWLGAIWVSAAAAVLVLPLVRARAAEPATI